MQSVTCPPKPRRRREIRPIQSPANRIVQNSALRTGNRRSEVRGKAGIGNSFIGIWNAILCPNLELPMLSTTLLGEHCLSKSRMREIFTYGSVRGSSPASAGRGIYSIAAPSSLPKVCARTLKNNTKFCPSGQIKWRSDIFGDRNAIGASTLREGPLSRCRVGTAYLQAQSVVPLRMRGQAHRGACRRLRLRRARARRTF